MKKGCFLLLVLVSTCTLFGCLGDEVDRPQVIAQLIYPPGTSYYKAITSTTDVQIRWTRSVSDIQGNFRGYFVRLYTSFLLDSIESPSSVDSLGIEIDSIHTGAGDTSAIFHNLTEGVRYTARVYGERFPENPDSLVLSASPTDISFYFDSRAVLAPSAAFASSAGPTSVNLAWNRSPSEGQLGMAGYVVRFQDAENSSAKVTDFYGNRINKPYQSTDPLFRLETPVIVPGSISAPLEKRYKFWIKAVRKDSVESDDSVLIEWSGAERLTPSPLTVRIDTAVAFLSNGGGGYIMTPLVPSNANAQFTVKYDGVTVTFVGIGSTKFVPTVDIDTSLRAPHLDRLYFSSPFEDNVFTEQSVSLPTAPFQGGAQLYMYVPGVGKSRIFVPVDSSGYVKNPTLPNASISIEASFQPKGGLGILPFF